MKKPAMESLSKYIKMGVFLLGVFMQMSCSVEPAIINYGSDQCHFCKMTIVDTQHAAQFVTSKGKAYKFDAIECMMKELKVQDESNVDIILIVDYENPRQLIDAKSASYLVSENIPSPMGAYLSGFESLEVRDWTLKESGGLAYDWSDLKQKFSN